MKNENVSPGILNHLKLKGGDLEVKISEVFSNFFFNNIFKRGEV